MTGDTSTFTRRALITFLTPVLLVLVSSRLLLPGMSELAEQAHSSSERFGVFALGITPLVAAYQLVEIVAFLVPPWSRRRHGDPAFRATLDLAVHFVTLVLAVIQAFGVALQLRALTMDAPFASATISVPIVMLTLVGGVFLQVVLAKMITRMGLANGVAVLLAASVLGQMVGNFMERIHPRPTRGGGMLGLFSSSGPVTPVAIAIIVVAIALAALATIVALARASGMHLGADEAKGGPYRSAKALVLNPSFPVPSSSYGASTIATALVTLPAALARLRVPGSLALERALGSSPASFIGALLVMMFLLSFWMHRPRELADVSERLGIKTDASETRRALVSTLFPSFLFFVVMMLADLAGGLDVAELPLAIAVMMDVIASSRLARESGSWTPVWEERRATAVPVLRAVLAARGIASEVTGVHLLWLMQLFAPFAPAVILVKEEERERAHAILTSLAFAPDDATVAEPVKLHAPELAPRRRAVYLGGLVVASALLLLIGMRLREGGFESEPTAAKGPPARLELTRVDDVADPLAAIPDESLPEGSGISIYRENAPVGPADTRQVHFARIVAKRGEPKEQTRARLQAFLDKVPAQGNGERAYFALEELEDVDDDTGKVSYVGYRSFLLTGAPELTNADVEDAVVILDRDTEEPSVAVTLTPQGAAKFEEVTGRWLQRRFAIVLDGVIQSAPVIKSRISGGRLTISMGRGEPEKNLADAHRLERTLRGRHAR